MSRRDPRIRAQMTATMTLEGSEDVIVCRTRDISHRGCFLDTAQLVTPGQRVHVAILDELRGAALEIDGMVTRCLPPGSDGLGRGIGVRFDHPPPEWSALVQIYQREHQPARPSPRRMTVLVVGDRARQRAAMALYVTSGWDVRFASELDSAEDALSGVGLDAVIVESDLDDTRWKDILGLARERQPQARRIVRTALSGQLPPQSSGPKDIFHRMVDRDEGLDPLLDALTAEFS